MSDSEGHSSRRRSRRHGSSGKHGHGGKSKCGCDKRREKRNDKSDSDDDHDEKYSQRDETCDKGKRDDKCGKEHREEHGRKCGECDKCDKCIDKCFVDCVTKALATTLLELVEAQPVPSTADRVARVLELVCACGRGECVEPSVCGDESDDEVKTEHTERDKCGNCRKTTCVCTREKRDCRDNDCKLNKCDKEAFAAWLRARSLASGEVGLSSIFGLSFYLCHINQLPKDCAILPQ